MSFGLNFRGELGGVSGWLVEEFDQFYARLNTYLKAEHLEDGTHGDLTCDSLTVNGNSDLLGELQIGAVTLGETFSDAPAPNILIDATNGLAVRYGTTDKMTLDMSGNATFTGTVNATAGYFGDGATRVAIEAAGINVGTTGSIRGGQTAYKTGTGFWLGYSGGAYKFSIGDGTTTIGKSLYWDGTDLNLGGSRLYLGYNGSANGLIGLWSADTLRAGVDGVATPGSVIKVLSNILFLENLLGAVAVSSSDVWLNTTKKLIFDNGDGHTYAVESSDGVLDLYAGAANALKLTATAGTFVGTVQGTFYGAGVAPLTDRRFYCNWDAVTTATKYGYVAILAGASGAGNSNMAGYFSASGAANNYALYVGAGDTVLAGGLISYGANDTGGAGYRLVRVPNA
jgi:hypothetical protein